MKTLDYVAICELAETPIIATIFREVRAYPGGPQTGTYALVLAPGNCLPSGHCFISVWPDTIIDLDGAEANDNAIGAVWN